LAGKSKLPEAKRKETTDRLTDQAIDCLKKAKKRGLQDAAKLCTEPDLGFLRDNKPFRQLLAEMAK